MYVELDVPDDCRWGLDIHVVPEGLTEGIWPGGPQGDGCILVGRCLELTYYDVVILSVLGSLLMISAVGEAPTRTDGLLMSVRSPRLEVFPENV
ncbi:hypothetical protein ND748_16465 [Frankia sp. AiPs1]|uniref:hypothetical protein n=1 Tax=Frankia sp. AiPs1 TaxID=573493 RepID=UPI0020443E98|nr:hypothetical protein [Frankia sp. AiPs1]MCM3923249.1 hypothetical protein [Frankia sp. AiPs1]